MPTQAHVLLRITDDTAKTEDDRKALQEWLSMRRREVRAHWTEDDAAPGRPHLKAILADLRKEHHVRHCSALIVVRLTDISESVGKLVVILSELVRKNVSVVSVADKMVLERGSSLKAGPLLHRLAIIEKNHRRHTRQNAASKAAERGSVIGRPRYVWTDELLDQLKALLRGGLSIRQIAKKELMRVPMSNGDVSSPSATALRSALEADQLAASGSGASPAQPDG